jgi:MFS family permease
MVYIQQTLGIQDVDGGIDFTLTLVIVLLTSSFITVIFGLFMDKIGKNKIIIPSVAVTVIGAMIMFFIREGSFAKVGVMIGGTILMTGYMLGTAVLGAKVRDYTPVNEAGLFQGVRMIFFVLIPMVSGPFIGRGVSYINPVFYENEFGQTVIRPNEYIFLFAAIVVSLAVIPALYMLLKERKNKNEQPEATAE